MACCGNRGRATSRERPITLGDPNGADPIRATINQRSFGLRIYTVAWFTGSGVDAAVAARVITPV